MQLQRKGSKLEDRFKKWLKYWNNQDHIQAVRLEVGRTYKKNIHTGKQPCDYIVVNHYFNVVHFIDAKECSSEKFYPRKQPLHQREALKKAQRNKNEGAWVVWFRLLDPAMTNIRYITQMEKPCTIEDGVPFDWVNFFTGGDE